MTTVLETGSFKGPLSLLSPLEGPVIVSCRVRKPREMSMGEEGLKKREYGVGTTRNRWDRGWW